MPRQIDAIVNPVAGHGRTRRRWPGVRERLAALGFDIRVHETTGPDHATTIARDLLLEGSRDILVVGGDGTVNEVVNGFFTDGAPIAPDATLGVVPGGTGRDFCRSLGIRSLDDALASLALGRVTRIDVGRITYQHGEDRIDRYFVNVADVGLGAETAAYLNSRSSKALGGFLAYLVGAARTMLVFQGRPARVVVDGQEVHNGPIAIAVLANGRYFAGGMFIAPMASLTDGKFEILILRDVPRRVLLGSLLPRVYLGKHVGHPDVVHLQGVELEVTGVDHLPFQVDGEQPGTTDLRAVILPGALSVRTLASGPR
ncbi:MAG TPA: diacylglycerol kinase family protein [Thermomicrobiaceae bacterium]|nr:diacylglycerol kinase family protein [Thermomicrobiaceae bacterium]